jgi:hypothetical protein
LVDTLLATGIQVDVELVDRGNSHIRIDVELTFNSFARPAQARSRSAMRAEDVSAAILRTCGGGQPVLFSDLAAMVAEALLIQFRGVAAVEATVWLAVDARLSNDREVFAMRARRERTRPDAAQGRRIRGPKPR